MLYTLSLLAILTMTCQTATGQTDTNPIKKNFLIPQTQNLQEKHSDAYNIKIIRGRLSIRFNYVSEINNSPSLTTITGDGIIIGNNNLLTMQGLKKLQTGNIIAPRRNGGCK